MQRPATLFEILLVKSSASKEQMQKHYHKMGLLTHIDAGVDGEFFKTISRAFQSFSLMQRKKHAVCFGGKKPKKF